MKPSDFGLDFIEESVPVQRSRMMRLDQGDRGLHGPAVRVQRSPLSWYMTCQVRRDVNPMLVRRLHLSVGPRSPLSWYMTTCQVRWDVNPMLV